MTNKAFLISLLLLFVASVGVQSQPVVSNVVGFPTAEPGYSLGVSACYAGRIGGRLVVAGGCNFPGQGKPKKYYAGIYAARIDEHVLNWHLVGWLPEEAAYGVAVESGDSLLIVGGNNAAHALRTVYSVHLDEWGSRAVVRRLADLPCTIDNMACAKDGGSVYIVGGNHDGCPSSAIVCMTLDGAEDSSTANAWHFVGSVPGSARVQPVSVARDGRVYVWGGFFADGERSEVHTDGYCLDVRSGEWTRLAAPRSVDGEELTLSGGIAWRCGERMYAAGGVNRDIFLDAISGRYERVSQANYLLQPIEWYRFSGNLCEFDLVRGEWLPTRLWAKSLARAGSQAVTTPCGTFYIGGELKPALRTPQIVLCKP